jgi:PAS domain S-box-containing protein
VRSSWLEFAANHKLLILITAGWLGVCAAGLTTIERWVWRPLGYPELVFELFETVCFVLAGLTAVLVLWRRSARRNTGFESTLSQCFEDSHAGVCMLDHEGCVVQCNRAFADFLGYPEPELLGMPYLNLLHPDEANNVPTPWRIAGGGGGQPMSRIRKYSGKDGGVRWGKPATSSLGDEHKPARVMVIVQDVTLEQEALKSLESSEQALRELLDEARRNQQRVLLLAQAVESTTDSIVITDLSGSIEYVNPHFEKLTGYTRTEVYGKNPRVLQSGRQPREFYADLWRTLKSGGVWHGRFINRRKDGTLYTEEATISPVHDAYGIPQKYVAVKRDVTRLEELEGQLRQAQKMEAVGQLAGGIAHDLNNVLQVVTLASHLALTSSDLEFKDARIKETVDAAQKGAGIIRQLLAFSRRQLMRPEVLRLNEVIHDTVKLLKHLLQEDIKLRLDLDHELGNIKADPIQITQVMLNLALNARDAMPEGGLLEISTENFEVTAESEAVTSQVPPGGYVRMIVRDTGTGMDEATQSRVFEPFFTTKETGKGTGLGLSTVYGIVIQSGGFIRFDSAVGVGTTFFVCFPRTQQPMAAPPHEVNRAEVALTPERCSVLVVEDEEMVRNSMAEALRRQGFRVHASGSSQEAWEAAVKLKPNLVIADVVMAGMKGPELIGLLKMHNPSIQTILISGYSDAEQVRLATAAHASLFIPKPFNMSDLVESAIRLCKLRQ